MMKLSAEELIAMLKLDLKLAKKADEQDISSAYVSPALRYIEDALARIEDWEKANA